MQFDLPTERRVTGMQMVSGAVRDGVPFSGHGRQLRGQRTGAGLCHIAYQALLSFPDAAWGVTVLTGVCALALISGC